MGAIIRSRPITPCRRVRILCASALLSLIGASLADDEFEELAALWSIADEPYRPVTRTLETPSFVHHKVMSIDAASLADGWVENRQCHRNFPLFPSLQIAFREGAVRNMRITEHSDVERVWVDGPTIQMKRTRPRTTLCFLSENHTVKYDLWNDEYRMTVGPYYLKFFDGYFPLNVDLTIEYPTGAMRFLGLEPTTVEGANIVHEAGRIRFNALFEGKLELVFRFKRT